MKHKDILKELDTITDDVKRKAAKKVIEDNLPDIKDEESEDGRDTVVKESIEADLKALMQRFRMNASNFKKKKKSTKTPSKRANKKRVVKRKTAAASRKKNRKKKK